MAAPLVIDCDPGVDDAIAILLALASPELDLLALTTVAGNLPLETTTRNALRVLALAGREDVPVAAGAARPLVVPRWRDAAVVHGADGLGGAPGAGVAGGRRADARRRPAGRGARAQRASPCCSRRSGRSPTSRCWPRCGPELLPRLGRVAVMGGSDGHGNKTPAAEFNIWFDPESASAHVRLGARHHDGRPQRDAERDAHRRRTSSPSAAPGPIGAVAAAMLDHYLDWHGRNRTAQRGVPVHDALAVATLVRPELVTTIDALVTVDTTAGPARGMTLVDRYRWEGEAANAQVAQTVDRDAFVAFLCERIASLDRG